MATANSGQTADIRRFTGFIAIDNTTHETEKKAIEHTRQVKIAGAVDKLSEQLFAAANAANEASGSPGPGFGTDDRENVVIFDADDLTALLLTNREAILAAFNQEVRLRKERTPRPKKPAAPAPETGAAT